MFAFISFKKMPKIQASEKLGKPPNRFKYIEIYP